MYQTDLKVNRFAWAFQADLLQGRFRGLELVFRPARFFRAGHGQRSRSIDEGDHPDLGRWTKQTHFCEAMTPREAYFETSIEMSQLERT